MRDIDKVITREKPEEIRISWINTDELIAAIDNEFFIPVCDLCNNIIDWSPFPSIDYPSVEELADANYIPIPTEGKALCQACAIREYGLKSSDTGNVDRLWVCFDAIEVHRDMT